MKYIKLFNNDAEYQAFREGKDWNYVNPLINLLTDKSKIILSKNIFPVNIQLTPICNYEDDYIVEYEFKLNEKDKAIINELYCVYNPLFKLNKEEIEIANETDGHLAKHISRDTSIFPFYINSVPIKSVSKYFQYDNYNYEIPTYKYDYYEINDDDDNNLIKQLSSDVGQIWYNWSDMHMRFYENNIFINITYNK